jgi:hypothetical protein
VAEEIGLGLNGNGRISTMASLEATTIVGAGSEVTMTASTSSEAMAGTGGETRGAK